MIPGIEPVTTTALIFGGCCTNVFALEAIVKVEPSSGMYTFIDDLTVMLTVHRSDHHFSAICLCDILRLPEPIRAWGEVHTTGSQSAHEKMGIHSLHVLWHQYVEQLGICLQH